MKLERFTPEDFPGMLRFTLENVSESDLGIVVNYGFHGWLDIDKLPVGESESMKCRFTSPTKDPFYIELLPHDAISIVRRVTCRARAFPQGSYQIVGHYREDPGRQDACGSQRYASLCFLGELTSNPVTVHLSTTIEPHRSEPQNGGR